jgi:hypothetical protein
LLPGVYGRPDAFVCSQEEVKAVHRHADREEMPVINEYRRQYFAAFNRKPRGLHYLPKLGPVWLPFD